MKVRVTKLDAVESARYPTPAKEDYIPGQYNGAVSLPIEYWVEGTITEEPKVGFPVFINRYMRNGESVAGVMCTSRVTKVSPGQFETANSIYKIEYLD